MPSPKRLLDPVDDSFIGVRRLETGFIQIIFPQPCQGLELDNESTRKLIEKLKAVLESRITTV